MSLPLQEPFDFVVDIYLTQQEHQVAPLVRRTHHHLIKSAKNETDADRLVAGMYRLRHYLAEGGGDNLPLWLFNLASTFGRTHAATSAVQRELTFGWLLMMNDRLDLAVHSYERASVELEALNANGGEMVSWSQVHQVDADIRICQFFIKANNDPTENDVHDALKMWGDLVRSGRQEQEKRLMLAITSLKDRSGMGSTVYANAIDSYTFYLSRGMNTEAGLAALHLARHFAVVEDIDPLTTPATGDTLRWLLEAARRWHDIDLPVGKRILVPYLQPLGLDLAPRKGVDWKKNRAVPETFSLN